MFEFFHYEWATLSLWDASRLKGICQMGYKLSYNKNRGMWILWQWGEMIGEIKKI